MKTKAHATPSTSVAAGRGWEALSRCGPVLAVLVLWELSARLGWVDATFFPPFSRVLKTLGQLARDGALVSHVLVSSFRAIAGFLLAIGLGVPLGLVFGWTAPRAYEVLEPALRIASQVNPFALMSLFLLFFGGGEVVKIVAVGWVALWPILFYTVTGVAHVDPSLLRVARSFGLKGHALVWRVVLPSAAPTLFVGLRLATGLVFFILVAAEMLGASRGLGWLVHNSAMNYQIPGIYAGAVAVIVLGYGLHASVRSIEARLFPHVQAQAFAQGEVTRSAPERREVRPFGRRQYLALAFALTALLVAGGLEAWHVQSIDNAAASGHRE